MMRPDKRFGRWLFEKTGHLNTQNIQAAVKRAEPIGRIVDLGCGDGHNTLELVSGIAYTELWGVDTHEPSCEEARLRGIRAVCADLDNRLPFDNAFFDVVVSNQVIEHLADTDMFLSETYRVLKDGGTAVISTENMASWHNIVALFFGWQPFSATNYSTKTYPIGNPMALHAGEDDFAAMATRAGMMHRRIFAYRGLKEVFAAHGFHIAAVLGSGYHPLPPEFGRFDPRHAHFLTLAARKLIHFSTELGLRAVARMSAQ